MKITEHLYKISGVEYETNSNMYAMPYDGGIVLIDAGYKEDQYERASAALENWGLSMNDVTHIFLTHSHYDHAGNVKRFHDQGVKILASAADKERIEHENPEMEKLFGTPWIIGKVDEVISDGQVFDFPGGPRITAIATPGHCKGSMSYQIETDGKTAITTGDMFWTVPKPPEDAVDVELGFMGSEDFSLDDLISSLDKIRKIPADIFLPGHYYVYIGPKVQEICTRAYQKALQIKMNAQNEKASDEGGCDK